MWSTHRLGRHRCRTSMWAVWFAGDGCDPADREFPTTGLGRAVFDSGLPLVQAKKLYQLLHDAATGLSCDTHPLHLIWILLQSMENPVQVGNWSAYIKLVQRDGFLPDNIRAFAGVISHVCTVFCAGRCNLLCMPLLRPCSVCDLHRLCLADLVHILPQEQRQRERLLRPDRTPTKAVRVQHGTFLIAICLSQILKEEAEPQQAVKRWYVCCVGLAGVC